MRNVTVRKVSQAQGPTLAYFVTNTQYTVGAEKVFVVDVNKLMYINMQKQ